MDERKKARWRWVFAAGLAATVMVSSSIPGDRLRLAEWFSWQDKLAHAAMYFAMALLLARAMNVPRRNAWLVGGAAFAAATAFGAVEEAHQIMIPGRFATVGDALANGVGAGAAGLLWPVVQSKWP